MFEWGYTEADDLHTVRVYERERNRERERERERETRMGNLGVQGCKRSLLLNLGL
jgi:hypothetical protein